MHSRGNMVSVCVPRARLVSVAYVKVLLVMGPSRLVGMAGIRACLNLPLCEGRGGRANSASEGGGECGDALTWAGGLTWTRRKGGGGHWRLRADVNRREGQQWVGRSEQGSNAETCEERHWMGRKRGSRFVGNSLVVGRSDECTEAPGGQSYWWGGG